MLTLSVLCRPDELVPRLSCQLDVSIQVPSPGVAGPPSVSFSLGIPGQSLPCDAGRRLPQGLAKPPPSPPGDFHLYRALICSFPQVSVSNGLWPTDAQYLSGAGVDESLNPVNGGFGESPRLSSIQQHRLDV